MERFLAAMDERGPPNYSNVHKNMKNENVLYIGNDKAKDIPNNSIDYVLSIEDWTKELDINNFTEVYNKLYHYQVDQSTTLSTPIYDHLWLRLTRSGIHPAALTVSIPLYIRLNDFIEKNNIGEICFDDVGIPYEFIIKDLSEEYDIQIHDLYDGENMDMDGSTVSILLNHLPLYIDQLLPPMWRKPTNINSESDVAFILPPSQIDTILPVINQSEFQYSLISTNLSIKQLYYNYKHNKNFIPIQSFINFSDVISKMVPVYKSISDEEIQSEISTRLRNDFDVKLNITLNTLLENILKSNLNRISQGLAVEKLVQKLKCQKLVVTSLSPGIKSILYEANGKGLDTYYLPHSLTTPYSRIPPSDTTMFVPSRTGVEHMKEIGGLNNTSNLIPTGLPRLSKMDVENGINEVVDPSEGNGINILVGTQSMGDKIRKEFIELCESGAEKMYGDPDITIKIHPNESPEFYERIEFDDHYNIDIEKENLEYWIRNSDIMITINSNVGLEAAVLGTPTVIINPWIRCRSMPYSVYGPFPILESYDEVNSFFQSLSKKDISNYKSKQLKFVKNEYIFEDATENIVRIINED